MNRDRRKGNLPLPGPTLHSTPSTTQPVKWCYPHSGWAFKLQLTQLQRSFRAMPTGQIDLAILQWASVARETIRANHRTYPDWQCFTYPQGQTCWQQKRGKGNTVVRDPYQKKKSTLENLLWFHNFKIFYIFKIVHFFQWIILEMGFFQKVQIFIDSPSVSF